MTVCHAGHVFLLWQFMPLVRRRVSPFTPGHLLRILSFRPRSLLWRTRRPVRDFFSHGAVTRVTVKTVVQMRELLLAGRLSAPPALPTQGSRSRLADGLGRGVKGPSARRTAQRSVFFTRKRKATAACSTTHGIEYSAKDQGLTLVIRSGC